jgi:formylglycine-generating enzyme required for sulfatase activity
MLAPDATTRVTDPNLGCGVARFLLVLSLAVWALAPRALAQAPAELDIQLYAGLTITGGVGTVYQIRCLTDLAQANKASAWNCLEFLQLPASPYLWADKSASATARKFYQAVSFAAPSNMVFIPPGTFRMGSPTNELGRSQKENPQTEVTISRGFWMGEYLVTQGEYQALMGSNPSYFIADNGFSGDLTRPVDSVSWFEATDYCAALTQRERAAERIPNNTLYRLPTEAEWEYACRAWTSTRFGYGDDPGYTNLANYAWYYENSGGMTHPVGQKLPNAWGLFDMHGDLEEWCQDWYGPYLGGTVVDPQGPPTGLLRVIRGGYWEDNASYCRSASRNLHEPDAKHFHLGFRVLLAPSQP